jgi:hypothetical protein
VEILNVLKGLTLESLAFAPLPGDCKPDFPLASTASVRDIG